MHTRTHTPGKTPLTEWSARPIGYYLPKRRTSMSSAGFEPAIPAIKRLQVYALDRPATGIGSLIHQWQKFLWLCSIRRCRPIWNIPVFDGLSDLLISNDSLSNVSGESSRRFVLIHHKKWGRCCGGFSAGPSNCDSAVAAVGKVGIQDNDLLLELSARQPELSRVTSPVWYHFWKTEITAVP